MDMASATNAMLAIKIINGKSEIVQCSLNTCNCSGYKRFKRKEDFCRFRRFRFRAFHELLCPEVEKSRKKKIKSVQ